MKKWVWWVWLSGLLGCAGLPGTRPQDFAITIHEDGGMLPYGRSVTLNATQSTDETFIDGFQMDVQFQTSADDLDAVYEAVVDNRFTRIRTREEEVYDRGGSSIGVRLDGDYYDVADSGMSFVRSNWVEEYENVYAAAFQLVAPQPNAAAFTLTWDDSLAFGGWEMVLDMGPDYWGMTDTHSGTREVTIYSGNAAASYPITLSNRTSGNSITFSLDLTQYQGVTMSQEQGQPVLVGQR